MGSGWGWGSDSASFFFWPLQSSLQAKSELWQLAALRDHDSSTHESSFIKKKKKRYPDKKTERERGLVLLHKPWDSPEASLHDLKHLWAPSSCPQLEDDGGQHEEERVPAERDGEAAPHHHVRQTPSWNKRPITIMFYFVLKWNLNQIKSIYSTLHF